MLYLALTGGQLFHVEHLEKGCAYLPFSLSTSEWQELVDAGYCYRDGNVYRAHEVYSTPDFEMCAPDANGVSSEDGERAFEDSARYRLLLDKGFLQG